MKNLAMMSTLELIEHLYGIAHLLPEEDRVVLYELHMRAEAEYVAPMPRKLMDLDYAPIRIKD